MFNGNSGVPFSMNVVPAGSSNGGNSNGGMGGWGDGWVIWLFFILAICWGGFGNGGFGGGSNGSGGVMDAYVLNSDFATLQRQLDSGFAGVTSGITQVNNGLCNGFYQQAQLVNGVQMQIANEARGTDNAICNLGNSMMQGFNTANVTALQGQNALATQLADCCCKTQSGMKDIQYQNAQDTCAITNAINQASQAQIQNCNANYRALHDEIVANRIEDKNAQIAALTAQLNQADLRASQAAQNAYLLSELKPCPSPAYVVPNPNCCYGANVTFGNPYSSGCGCA